ncbi:hypothetical protein JB92DRAFT_3023612 [Gautieria morchelliformis]|nr:hypothetical protein JB92DRAFT_3023612 [Gautieria morchelliformis]
MRESGRWILVLWRFHPLTPLCLCCGSWDSLSALLFTVVLSDSENMRRHAVFFNFVSTYLMYTSVALFTDVVQFVAFAETDQTLGVLIIIDTVVDCMRLMALTATLNLVIHLWFEMRAAFSDAEAWTTKLRTFALLITPYLMGLVPLCELFDFAPTGIFLLLKAMDYMDLSLVVLTCIWDILLVVTFVSYRRIFRQANMGSIMSLSLLVRLSVFCSFRLLFAIMLVTWLSLQDGNPDSNTSMIMMGIVNIGESFYPLLAFLLLGLQRDILQIWFPCIHFGAKQTRSTPSQAESNWALDTEVLAIR